MPWDNICNHISFFSWKYHRFEKKHGEGMRTRMEFCKRMFCNILRYFWLHWNAGMLETGKVRSYLLWVFYPAICPDSTSNGSNLIFDAVFLIYIFKGIFFSGWWSDSSYQNDLHHTPYVIIYVTMTYMTSLFSIIWDWLNSFEELNLDPPWLFSL